MSTTKKKAKSKDGIDCKEYYDDYKEEDRPIPNSTQLRCIEP